MLATLPDDARAFNPAWVPPAKLHLDLVFLLVLAVWVVASRIPYLNDYSFLGKDGPLYINSLALDTKYDVPMPGNIGYVLLGKLATWIGLDPVTAFLAVNIGLTLLGVEFYYLFSALIVPRSLAAAMAFALSCNAIVWYHGGIIASYPVWLAVLPAIGWFGVRYKRGKQFGDLIGRASRSGSGRFSGPTCFSLELRSGSAVLRGPSTLATLADWRVDRRAGLRMLVLRDGLGPWRGGCLSRAGQGQARIRPDGLFRIRAGDGRRLDAERREIRPLSRLGRVDRARSVRLGSRVRVDGVESALAGIAARSALGRAVVVLLIPDLRGERGLDFSVAPVALPRRGAGIPATLGPPQAAARRRRDAVAGSFQPGSVCRNPVENGEEST